MLRRATPLLVLAVGAAYAGICACGSFAGGADATDAGAAEGGDAGAPDAAAAADTGTADDAATRSDGGPAGSGCADGTREGFVDAAVFVDVAACEGAFSLAGLPTPGKRTCASGGGNSSVMPKGTGCSANDLCSLGWHVCSNSFEFASAGGNCVAALADRPDPTVFFASAQPFAGGVCKLAATDDGGLNDVFGCGRGVDVTSNCGAFTATLGDGCFSGLPQWQCTQGSMERANVMKSQGPGGVLCCRD